MVKQWTPPEWSTGGGQVPEAAPIEKAPLPAAPVNIKPGVKQWTPPEWGNVGSTKVSEKLEAPGGYWANPRTLAMHYQLMQANPELDYASMGWNKDVIDQAYKYLQQTQGGNWMDWQQLGADDPMGAFLNALPDPSVMYGSPALASEYWKQLDAFTPPAPAAQAPNAPAVQPWRPTAEEWESLPEWQKLVLGSYGSTVANVAGMLPVSLAAGAIGSIGGPWGAILGASLPLGLAFGASKLMESNAPEGLKAAANQVMNALNWLSATEEKGIGTAIQFGQPMLKAFEVGIPELMWGNMAGYADAFLKANSDLSKLIDNLPAVWKASELTYEATAPTWAGQVANIPAGIEYLWDKAWTGETDVTFAPQNKVWKLDAGRLVPTALPYDGLAALNMARQEIANPGSVPNQVIKKYQDAFGFSGQFTDLFYQTAADPLNVLPAAEIAATKKVAGLTRNVPLMQAAEAASNEGMLGLMKKYSEAIKFAEPETLSNLQKRIGGVSDQGLIKALDKSYIIPKPEGVNPLAWWKWMNDLSPSARVDMGTKLLFENLPYLWEKSAHDPAEFRRILEYVTGKLSASDAADIAKQVTGNSEIYTIRQFLADAMNDEKVTKFFDLYQASGNQRAKLRSISEALNEDIDGLVGKLYNADNAEVGKLFERIAEKSPGLFKDVDEFADFRKFISENPYVSDPDRFFAAANQAITDQGTAWMRDAFGVKEAPGILRLANGLKSLQSAVLLNLNPMYAIRNVQTNMMTRMVDGLFGMKKQTDMINDIHRHGLSMYFPEGGIGGLSNPEIARRADIDFNKLLAEGKLAEAEYVTVARAEQQLRAAQSGKGALTSFENWARNVSRKIPGVSGMAHANDIAETLRAHYYGFTQARAPMWRPGVMISDMQPELLNSLRAIDERLPARLMSMIQEAKSAKDLQAILKGNAEVSAGWFLDDVANEFGVDPVYLREALDNSGVLEKINSRIKSGQSVTDAIQGADREVMEWIQNRAKDDLALWGKTVEEAVKMNGFPAMLRGFVEVQVRLDEVWTRHFDEWNRTMDLVTGVDREARSAIIEDRFDQQDVSWKFHKKWTEETYNGMLRGAGMNEAGRTGFISEVRALNEGWNEFYSKTRSLRKDFQKKVKGLDPYDPEANRLWNELQDKINNLKADYDAKEMAAYDKISMAASAMFRMQFGLGKDAGVKGWWDKIKETSQVRQSQMNTFRDWERGVNVWYMPDANPDVVRFLTDFYGRQRIEIPQEGFTQAKVKPDIGLKHTAWPEFIAKVYRPTIQKYIMDAWDGAMKMYQDYSSSGAAFGMNKQWYKGRGADLMRPRHELPDLISQRIAREAATMLSEMEPGGWRGGLSLVPVEGGRGGPSQMKRVSVNPEWYKDLYNNQGIGRDQVQAALERIIEDKGKDVIRGDEKSIELVKSEILSRLDEQSNFDPGYLLMIGDEAGALDALRRVFEEGQEVISNWTDADWAEFLGGQQNFDYLMSRFMGEDVPAQGPIPLGAEEGSGALPDTFFSEIYEDALGTRIRPIMDGLQYKMMREVPVANNNLKLTDLDARSKKLLQGYVEQLSSDIEKTNRMAYNFGNLKREMAMLNYNKRYNADAWAQMFFPYHFWPTRTLTNWSMRMMDRPATMAFFSRFADKMNEKNPYSGILPSRLRGKLRIPGMVPKWMGGGVWVDPYSIMFPFREFMRPYERIMQDQNNITSAAGELIREQLKRGEITKEEADAALQSKSGPIWEAAYKASQTEEGGDWQDFMSLFMSPALYLSAPANAMMGDYDKIGMMPIQRYIQGTAGALGLPGLANVDLLGKWYQSKKVSEFGQWGDYYVGRQLMEMVAEGLITDVEANQALLDKSGEAWEAGKQRVRQELAYQQPGLNILSTGVNLLKGKTTASDMAKALMFGWIPQSLLPEAELKVRGLTDEWYKAIQAQHNGDAEAIDNFLADHPEYKTRLALYDDPEDRLHNLLVSEFWDNWDSQSDLDKKIFKDAFGTPLTDVLLPAKPGYQDKIDNQTLATIIRALKGNTFGVEAPEFGIETTPQDVNSFYAQFEATRDALFPGISQILGMINDLPEAQRKDVRSKIPQLNDYYTFYDRFLANNPKMIPYMISKDNRLYGAPPEVQEAMYQFYAIKAERFAGVEDLWNEYYARGKPKGFVRQHPIMGQYLDFRDSFIAWYPATIPYLKSAESIAEGVLGKGYKSEFGIPETAPVEDQMSSYLKQVMLGAQFGKPLKPGAQAELVSIWEKNGKPFGSFEKWLQTMGIFQ